MIANYHTHTVRCNHAVGTEREYIETAIARGIQVLGFSDHSPYVFPSAWNYYSGHRMNLTDETESYFQTLLDLRQEYKGQIKIFIGLEAEYYPDLFDDFLSFLKPYPLDYLIMGQHFLGNELGESPCGCATEDAARLRRYVDQCLEGLRTGKFTYLAHPDNLNYTPDDAVYRKEMTRLCSSAKDLGIPMEVNFLGLEEKRHYPCDKFFSIVSQVGNDVVFGCDAHRPDAVGHPGNLAKAEAFAQKHHLHVLEELVLRPVW